VDARVTAGHIGQASAWGPISGEFHAAASIAGVASGGAVTATLTAPQVGSVIENDSTIQTQYPYPDAPDSITDAVLAEAQAVYNEVSAAKTQMATDIADLLAEYAAVKTQTVADSRAAVTDRNFDRTQRP